MMTPGDFPPRFDLGPPVITVPFEVEWGSANAYLEKPTHWLKGTDKYIPSPVRRDAIMREYYMLHPTCNVVCIRQILNIWFSGDCNQLSKADPTKLRDAYKILVESAQKIDVMLDEGQAGEGSEYFNDVFDPYKLKTQGADHVRRVKSSLEERAGLVKSVLLHMDADFRAYFTRGKRFPDAICKSKVKCKELLDYAYSYLIWHYRWKSFTDTEAGADMSMLDVSGMERGLDALERWLKKYRRANRWMKANRRPEPKTTKECVFTFLYGHRYATARSGWFA
jgi:hypothetical protein